MTARIVPADQLRAGPAIVVLVLGERTIRSRVEIAVVEPHGVVRVAFASGDIVTLSARTVVGVIDPRGRESARSGGRPRTPRRQPRTPAAAGPTAQAVVPAAPPCAAGPTQAVVPAAPPCAAVPGDSAPVPAALEPFRDRGSYRGAYASVAELGNILRPVLGIDAGLPRAEREQIARELCRRGELWITTHDGAVHVFGRPGSSADLLLADERPPLTQPRGQEKTP